MTGTVLVFGDDDRSVLAVVRSLGRAGKQVHLVPFNWHSATAQSRYVSAVHYLPRYSDDAAGWLEGLRALVDNHEYDLLIPCCERTILPLDQHRALFTDQTIAIPASTTLVTLNDKQRTRALCADLGIPTARGRAVRADDTAEGLVAEFGLPLLIKATQSYLLAQLTSRGGVKLVRELGELEAVLAGAPVRDGLLVERFFEGEGVGLSVLANGGVVSHPFQHRRLGETGTEGGSSLRASEAVDPVLLDAVTRLAAATQLTGVAMFEFRRNRQTRDFILIEVNVRFWGSLPLAIAAGVDFPIYLHDQLVTGATHPEPPYRVGLRARNFLRDLNAIVMTFGAGVAYWPRALLRLGGFLCQPIGWLLGRERSDTFARDDLRPAFAQLLMAGTTATNRAHRRANPKLERRARRKSG